jgi:hypothetical protein
MIACVCAKDARACSVVSVCFTRIVDCSVLVLRRDAKLGRDLIMSSAGLALRAALRPFSFTIAGTAGPEISGATGDVGSSLSVSAAVDPNVL